MQARSFGAAPQLHWTRALAYDRRPASSQDRSARALSTVSQLFLEIINAAPGTVAHDPARQCTLIAVMRTCDLTLTTLGSTSDATIASWLRRCRSAADTCIHTSTLADDELASLRDDLEQAQDAATTALTALRHASGESWRDWVSTATASGGSASHAYIRDREAWQPPVVRRRADLRPTGRTDCIITHHTQTWAEHWCRSDLSHHTDAHITSALETYPAHAALPPITPAQLREAATTFTTRTTMAPDGFHGRHFRIPSDAGLAVLCANWECIEASGVYPSQIARVTAPLIPKKDSDGLCPIGALPALYRVALKCRRPYLDAFDASIPQALLLRF